MREVIHPVIAGMKAEGIPFTGFLYAGLMITPEGRIGVLEFNCRMGDPETQPILMRLKTDLTTLMEAAIDGRLNQVTAEWDRRVALGIVLAAAGYPDSPRTGDVITNIPTPTENAVVFHAGTLLQDGQLRTSGGRVLCATALGDSVKHAQKHAYALAHSVQFDGCQMRSDIGWRALK